MAKMLVGIVAMRLPDGTFDMNVRNIYRDVPDETRIDADGNMLNPDDLVFGG